MWNFCLSLRWLLIPLITMLRSWKSNEQQLILLHAKLQLKWNSNLRGNIPAKWGHFLLKNKRQIHKRQGTYFAHVQYSSLGITYGYPSFARSKSWAHRSNFPNPRVKVSPPKIVINYQHGDYPCYDFPWGNFQDWKLVSSPPNNNKGDI